MPYYHIRRPLRWSSVRAHNRKHPSNSTYPIAIQSPTATDSHHSPIVASQLPGLQPPSLQVSRPPVLIPLDLPSRTAISLVLRASGPLPQAATGWQHSGTRTPGGAFKIDENHTLWSEPPLAPLKIDENRTVSPQKTLNPSKIDESHPLWSQKTLQPSKIDENHILWLQISEYRLIPQI